MPGFLTNIISILHIKRLRLRHMKQMPLSHLGDPKCLQGEHCKPLMQTCLSITALLVAMTRSIEMVYSSRSPVLFVLIEFIWGKWKKSKRRGISKQYLSVIVPTSGGPTTETIIPVSSPAPYWITNPLIFPLKFHKRSKFPVCLLLCFTSTS